MQVQKLFSLLLFFTVVNYSHAQFTHKIKADSVRIYNDNCNAEFIVENSTKDIAGFLFNRGNGRTEFRKAVIKLNDTSFIIGGDTLIVKTKDDFLPLAGGTLTEALEGTQSGFPSPQSLPRQIIPSNNPTPPNTTHKKIPQHHCQGIFLCGAEGTRTPVQTSPPLAFYMLISLLFVGREQETNKPTPNLAGWSYTTVTAFCYGNLCLF